MLIGFPIPNLLPAKISQHYGIDRKRLGLRFLARQTLYLLRDCSRSKDQLAGTK